MSKIKSIWTSITGSVSSGAPLLFACCKSGACVGVCASPVASLFGVSAAGFASSPWMDAAVPLLIALSAVSFTASYYKLYVLPKFAPACDTDCGCDTAKPSMNTKVSKAIFWTGLVASIGFFSFLNIKNFRQIIHLRQHLLVVLLRQVSVQLRQQLPLHLLVLMKKSHVAVKKNRYLSKK